MKIRHVDWYAADWLEGTAELCISDRGVYVTIVNLIYARGGPIKEELLKRCCIDHGNAINASLARLEALGKIVRNGQEIDQKRCEKELERSRKRVGKRLENLASSKENNVLEFPAVYNNQQSTISNQQKETRASRAPSNADAFDRWWEGYPDKVGKGAARKAFTKALTKTSLDQLISGVERYKSTKPVDRPWCNPATWLNQERWLDAPATNGYDRDVSFYEGPKGPPPKIEEWGLPLDKPH